MTTTMLIHQELKFLRARVSELETQLGVIQEKRAEAGRRAGRIGGKSTSDAKQKAARLNGADGGRPSKSAPRFELESELI